MTLIIRKDGKVYDLLEYGIKTVDVLISSPTPIHEYVDVEGKSGVVDYGSTLGVRNIQVTYRATSKDTTDFSLLRDEIFNIFRSDESFYLVEKRLQGKRWHVKVSSNYQIPQRYTYGNFTIDFDGLIGVSESIGTTQDVQTNGININPKLWGYGMGLIVDEESLIYNHNTKTFRIYNAGNVDIHPFENYLRIEMTGIVGKFEMKNNTTGDVFEINNNLQASDKFIIDGANMTLNNSQALRKTNRKYITLKAGWNEFTLNKTANINFDFRYYYQ